MRKWQIVFGLFLCSMGVTAIGAEAVSSDAQATALARLKVLECVKPDLSTYWKNGSSEKDDEFVIVYSIQGLWADIDSRFPPEIRQAIRDASEQALATTPFVLTARDMPDLAAKFYSELQKYLSNVGKLPPGACGIQVGQLRDIFNNKYHFSMKSSLMDSWYRDNRINELNVKNDQFLALYSKGSDIKGSCTIVFDRNSKVIKVCE